MRKMAISDDPIVDLLIPMNSKKKWMSIEEYLRAPNPQRELADLCYLVILNSKRNRNAESMASL